MKKKSRFLVIFAMALVLPVTMMMVIMMAGAGFNVSSARPEGPCDIYAAAGNPCVAAHSSTRALYAAASTTATLKPTAGMTVTVQWKPLYPGCQQCSNTR